MTRRGRLAFAVLVIALSAALWRGLAGQRPPPELKGVYEVVQASAATDTVLVDVQHEHYLTIGIVGSSINDLPVARKRPAARDIAGRAYRRYPSPSALRFVVVAFVVLTGLLCLGVARLGGAAVDKARAKAAADAAALAAAGALTEGENAVQAARATAAANGAVLTRCQCSGTGATVEVRVNSARARARAEVTPSSPVTPSARESLVKPTLSSDFRHPSPTNRS